MAYKLPADEDMQAAVIRCAREQLDRAITELSEGVEDDPVAAVHTARKSIKKTRSLLRLVRGAIPAEQRRRENTTLRSAAGHVAGARDAEVLLATLDALSDRVVGQLPATTFETIQERLGAGREAQPPAPAAVGSSLEQLEAARRRVEDWQIDSSGWKAVDAGLLRSYKQGRKALKRARKRRQLEDLHNWRKRVKDLWYHTRLLEPGGGPAFKGQAKDAHHVSDLLGDDHDLGILSEAVECHRPELAVDVDAVLKLIDHRRAELQTEALRIGKRIYAEPPKAFRRRMKRSWTAGQATAAMAIEQRPRELAAATR